MENLKTDWKDIRALAINGTTITLLTETGGWVLNCGSASDLSEVLRFWTRNDSGPVRLPEGSMLALRPSKDVPSGSTA